jgi:hypothetical protein
VSVEAANQPVTRLGAVLGGGDGPSTQLGYVDGENLIIDRYSAEGHHERYPDLARQIVASHPDVIVTVSTRILIALKAATSTIPIVANMLEDPLKAGLVTSLAHPGNLTGVSRDAGVEIWGKRLQILKEAIPSASTVAFFGFRELWEGPAGHVLRDAGSGRDFGARRTLRAGEIRRGPCILTRIAAGGCAFGDYGAVNHRLRRGFARRDSDFAVARTDQTRDPGPEPAAEPDECRLNRIPHLGNRLPDDRVCVEPRGLGGSERTAHLPKSRVDFNNHAKHIPRNTSISASSAL